MGNFQSNGVEGNMEKIEMAKQKYKKKI